MGHETQDPRESPDRVERLASYLWGRFGPIPPLGASLQWVDQKEAMKDRWREAARETLAVLDA